MVKLWEPIHALGCSGEYTGGVGVGEKVGFVSSRSPPGGQSVHRHNNIAL